MTPTQAAKLIGCSPQQVRTLIRTGRLKATHLPSHYRCKYAISKAEAKRYRDAPQKQGWPRGQLYDLVPSEEG